MVHLLLISTCNVFHALARLSSDFQAATRRRNQHRFTPGDSINRTPKKQSRVINKETRPRAGLARRVRFPRDCIVWFISKGVYLTGWLFHVADHCCRCRPIIECGEVSYRSHYPTGGMGLLFYAALRRRVIKLCDSLLNR